MTVSIYHVYEEIERLTSDNEELNYRLKDCNSILREFVEWNKKYPPNRIYHHSQADRMIAELQAVMLMAENALNKETIINDTHDRQVC